MVCTRGQGRGRSDFCRDLKLYCGNQAHKLLGAVTRVTDPWYWYKHSMAYNPLYNVLLHNTSSSQQYNGAPHFIMEPIKLNYVTGAIRFWYQSHATGSIVTSTIRSPTFVNSVGWRALAGWLRWMSLGCNCILHRTGSGLVSLLCEPGFAHHHGPM